MTVKELINKLETMPADVVVFTYNNLAEEHGHTKGVTLIEKQEEMRYDQADAPDISKYNNRVVVIF